MLLPVFASVLVPVEGADVFTCFVSGFGSGVESGVGMGVGPGVGIGAGVGVGVGTGFTGCSMEPVNMIEPGLFSWNVKLTVVLLPRLVLSHVARPAAGSYVPLVGVMPVGAMGDPSIRFAVSTVTGELLVAGRVTFWSLAFISLTLVRR